MGNVQARSIQFALCAILYFVCAEVSVQLAGGTGRMAWIWIADFAVFSLLYRNPQLIGAAAFAGIFVGNIAGNLAIGADPSVSLAFGVVSVAYAKLLLLSAPVTANRTVPPLERVLNSVGWVVIVTFLIGGIFAGIAALFFKWPVGETILRYGLANTLGATLVLPTAMVVTKARLMALVEPASLARLAAWAALCGGVSVAAMGYFSDPFVAIVPILMAAAIRLPILDLVLVTLMSAVAVIGMVAGDHAASIEASSGGITAAFQFSATITFAMPLVAGVLIQQLTKGSQELAASEARFRRAMRESPVAMINVNVDGTIIEANPAFADMLGYPLDQIEGRSPSEFTPPEDLHIGSQVTEQAQRGEIDTATFQKRYRRSDGSLIWVEISASLIRNAKDGRPLCLISQVQDIDARKKAEASLAEMEDRWDFALASAGQGFWDHHVSEDTVTYSTTWTSMLGYDRGELDGSSDVWMHVIHPDDRAAVQEEDRRHQAGEIAYFELEYRMLHKNGLWLWVLDRGKVVERDASGKVLRMIGTLTDISQRKRTEEDLARTARLLADEKERLRVTLESIGDAVICTDSSQEITFINPAAQALTGYSVDEAIGKSLAAIYKAAPDGSATTPAGPSGASPWAIMTLTRKDRATRTIREVVSPILDENRGITGRVIVFQDFTELHSHQRQLERAAAHDELTGLANRANLMAYAETLHDNAKRDGAEHQLLFIDLDRFKLVNDTSGHIAGDALLKKVATAIKASVRSMDFVARLGGDEFCVILTSCPRGFGKLTAQAIVDKIGRLEFVWKGKKFKIGASIGLATLNAQSISVEDVIVRADQNCYAAKGAGRGLVSAPETDGATVVSLEATRRNLNR